MRWIPSLFPFLDESNEAQDGEIIWSNKLCSATPWAWVRLLTPVKIVAEVLRVHLNASSYIFLSALSVWRHPSRRCGLEQSFAKSCLLQSESRLLCFVCRSSQHLSYSLSLLPGGEAYTCFWVCSLLHRPGPQRTSSAKAYSLKTQK